MNNRKLQATLDLFLNEVKSAMAAGEWFEEESFRKFRDTANDTGNIGAIDYNPWRKDSLKFKIDGYYLDDDQ